MGDEGEDYVKLKERSLEVTPSWAVAVVVFVILAISIALEYILHLIGHWLHKKHKTALHEALEKIKAELMILGFISLLLTVGQGPISDICIPRKVARSWHPCKSKGEEKKYDDPCVKKGKVQMVSNYGIHQLHIFIFVLAVFHVIYCVLTLILGRLKMRKWKAWEDETKTVEYQFHNDPERFRFARETTFGRRHLRFWSNSTILLWIGNIVNWFKKKQESVRPRLLINITLALPVAITTVERCFSAMKLLKTDLRNRIGDDYMNDALISSVEKEALMYVKVEQVMELSKKGLTKRLTHKPLLFSGNSSPQLLKLITLLLDMASSMHI